jgi:hypothetical protein
MNRLFIIHRDDALNAAWEAFLAGIPMSWLPREAS